VNGPRALPAGSAHIVHFEPISVADLFHAKPSEAVELVLEGDEPPHVEVEPMKIAGIGYGEVVLRFPAGLEAGAHFALDYGNRQPDGTIAARVAPIHMRGLTFEIFTQLEQDGPRSSWLNTSWLEGLPTVDLVADAPSRVRLFGPTLVGTGAAFRLRLAVTDAYDSRSEPPFAGAIALEAPPGLLGLPGQLERTAGDASVGAIEGLSCPEPGIYRVSVDARQGQTSLGSSLGTMLVGGVDPEMTDPRLNEDTLQRVARASRGAVIPAGDINALLARLDESAPAALLALRKDLWHTGWSFAILAGLLAAEWLTRRRWGLR